MFVTFPYYKDGADNRTCSERSERNSGTGEFIRGSGASTLNDLLQATMLRIRAMNRTIVGYVRCARFPQMQALASLFACGQLHSVQGQTNIVPFADKT